MRNICVDCKEASVTVVSGEAHMSAPVIVTIETKNQGSLPLYLDHDQAVHFAAALVGASLHYCAPDLRGKFRNLVRDLLRSTSHRLGIKS